MRLGKRERAEARKASGFDARKAMVIANLSSPIARTPQRGLVNSSQATVLGSKSSRASVNPTTGRKDTSPKAMERERQLRARMAHRFMIVDQWERSWFGCDREKVAYAECARLSKHPDLKGLILKVVDNRQ